MDTVCLTTLYNPANYTSKYKNYELFRQNLQKYGIPLYTIECAFKKQKHYLPVDKYHFRVRSNSILWHKERLINLAVSQLPKSVKYVAWLDSDIIYDNPLWFDKLRGLLKNHLLVQSFETVYRLKKGFTDITSFEPHFSSFRLTSFAKRFSEDKNLSENGLPITHGASGFGWAANIEFFKEIGLYDASIVGSGDHLFSHAICGNIRSNCINNMISGKLKNHFLTYLAKTAIYVNESITFLPETIYHLWHGTHKNRQYYTRHQILNKFDFDPTKDIILNPEGCWEWNTAKCSMKSSIENYFHTRQEDN